MLGFRMSRLALAFPVWMSMTTALVGCPRDNPEDDRKPGAPVDGKADPTAEFEPTFKKTACPFDVPRGAKVECGTLTVPENYDKPEAGLLKLAVARYESSSDKPAGLFGLPSNSMGPCGASRAWWITQTVARFAISSVPPHDRGQR